MITADDLREYLTEMGLALPDTIIECLVAQMNTHQECLERLGLEPCAITLALIQAAAILSLGMGAKRITSHTAPSGASQSFSYGSQAELSSFLIASIKALGAWPCLGPTLPQQPGPKAGLMVGLGLRARRCR